MLLISFQVVIALLLLVGALRLHKSLIAERGTTLEGLLTALEPQDWGFESIGHGSLFSEGLDIAIDKTWDEISGVKGLWRMFWNVGALVKLADYVAATNAFTPSLSMQVSALRVKAIQVRLAVLKALLRHCLIFASKKKKLSNAHQATWCYSAVVAHTSFIFRDYGPLLLPKYLYAMKKTA